MYIFACTTYYITNVCIFSLKILKSVFFYTYTNIQTGIPKLQCNNLTVDSVIKNRKILLYRTG